MKRIYTFITLLAVGSVTFIGCSAGKNVAKDTSATGIGTTVVKTVATAVGLIFLAKLIKSVLGTVTTSTAFSGFSQNQSFTANFNEETKLNSFAQGDIMKAALQVLVSERYKIPLTKVSSSYRSLVTVGDLATFIGQNADAKVLSTIK